MAAKISFRFCVTPNGTAAQRRGPPAASILEREGPRNLAAQRAASVCSGLVRRPFERKVRSDDLTIPTRPRRDSAKHPNLRDSRSPTGHNYCPSHTWREAARLVTDLADRINVKFNAASCSI
jgi:hypothetical protein